MATRRLAERFALTSEVDSVPTIDQAVARLFADMKVGQPAEPVQSCERRRPPLLDLGKRVPCTAFQLLAGAPIRWAAMKTVMEIYLAPPNPDNNFAADRRTLAFQESISSVSIF